MAQCGGRLKWSRHTCRREPDFELRARRLRDHRRRPGRRRPPARRFHHAAMLGSPSTPTRPWPGWTPCSMRSRPRAAGGSTSASSKWSPTRTRPGGKVSSLSGGGRQACGAGARWSRARPAAARRTTNHLDLDGIHQWLEGLIRTFAARSSSSPRPRLPRQRRHPHHRARPRPAGELPERFSDYQRRKAEELEAEEKAAAPLTVPRPGGVDPQGRGGPAHPQRRPRASAPRPCATRAARRHASATSAWRSTPATRAARWSPNHRVSKRYGDKVVVRISPPHPAHVASASSAQPWRRQDHAV